MADQSLEERISDLEQNVVQLIGKNYALTVLFVALWQNHPQQEKVLQDAEAWVSSIEGQALFQPVSDALAEFVTLGARQFLDGLKRGIRPKKT